jgi:DNA-binding ferritin-like protein (Dps family)
MMSIPEQIMNDASHHEVIRARLKSIRSSIAQVAVGERVLNAAAPITSRLSPIVNQIDNHFSEVITSCKTISEPRHVTDVKRVDISADKLRNDATNGVFFTERLNDINNASKVVRNTFEEKAGGLARFTVHATSACNTWWAWPLTNAVTSIGTPVVHLADRGMGAISNQIAQHNLTESLKQIVPGFQNAISADSLKDLIKVDVITYADLVLGRARAVANQAKQNEQLNKAVEVATAQLNVLKSHLSPHSDAMHQRLQNVADLGRQARFKTLSYTDNFWQNFADAYGKTSKLTESTIAYLDSHEMRLIPSDVYEFCRKMLGLQDKDQSYNDLLAQLKELFDSLTHVFALTQQKSAHQTTDTQASLASPIAA